MKDTCDYCDNLANFWWTVYVPTMRTLSLCSEHASKVRVVAC